MLNVYRRAVNTPNRKPRENIRTLPVPCLDAGLEYYKCRVPIDSGITKLRKAIRDESQTRITLPQSETRKKPHGVLWKPESLTLKVVAFGKIYLQTCVKGATATLAADATPRLFAENLFQTIRASCLKLIGCQDSVLRYARRVSDHISDTTKIFTLKALDSLGRLTWQSRPYLLAP